MIYFIVTTSLFNKCDVRKHQYVNGIHKLKKVIKEQKINDYKIIIVENNGMKYTFLNLFDCDVFYTTNNRLSNNKGYKELQDVLDCIEHFNINDTDFIVKMTGRYILDNNSEFMNVIKNIHNTKYECVIKYGPYYAPVNFKTNDCITGLIGMLCRYIKQIKKPNERECVEWKWGEVTKLIDDDKICLVNNLGINICPNSNTYFFV